MSRPGVDRQLERLLVMVPWVMAHECTHQQGPTVEEVCERFDISPGELESNLELLFMCGLYPFTPDTLIEADIVDGRVWIRSAEGFERPPFFRPEEALALVAAASAVIALQGNENNVALRSALTKLVGLLGIDDNDVVGVELANPQSELQGELRRAIVDRRIVALDYYSHGRDVWSRRRIRPIHTFNRDGHWYLQGVADEVGEVRNFRLDRMKDVTVLDKTFDAIDGLPPPSVYQPRPGDPTLVLDLDSRTRWVAEQYPTLSIESRPAKSGEGSVLRVTMAVSERLWAERLLLRLGAGVTVVSGDIDPKASARRILDRYE